MRRTALISAITAGAVLLRVRVCSRSREGAVFRCSGRDKKDFCDNDNRDIFEVPWGTSASSGIMSCFHSAGWWRANYAFCAEKTNFSLFGKHLQQWSKNSAFEWAPTNKAHCTGWNSDDALPQLTGCEQNNARKFPISKTIWRDHNPLDGELSADIASQSSSK